MQAIRCDQVNSNYILQHIRITVASKSEKGSGGSGGWGAGVGGIHGDKHDEDKILRMLDVGWEKGDVMRSKLQKYYVHSWCNAVYILCVLLCAFFV